jgi:hypothetical protein
LSIAPRSPDIIYAGTYSEGVFKSVDSGTSWTPINTGLTDLYIWTMAINPASPNTLYVATSFDGIFKTVDGGASWSPINNGLTDFYVSTLAVDPANQNVLYAGTYGSGVFKTTDGGASWSPTNLGLTNPYIYTLAINPAIPNILYAGTEGSGVIQSIDGGSTWAPMNAGLTNRFVWAISIDLANSNIIYAGTDGDGVFAITIESSDIFSDISTGYWAKDFIIMIYTGGITVGCTQDNPDTPENERKYCPEDTVTREQMAAFITRAMDELTPVGYCGTSDPFSDVNNDRWSCQYIKRLAEIGVTTGYGDGRFGPEDLVTREQMAVFLIRALDQVPESGYCGTTSPFIDVSFDRWSCDYVRKLAELGITTGYGDGRFWAK